MIKAIKNRMSTRTYIKDSLSLIEVNKSSRLLLDIKGPLGRLYISP
ncbi:hypothetical protein RI065_01665 [Mycoplasmatota bacterium zrk1]